MAPYQHRCYLSDPSQPHYLSHNLTRRLPTPCHTCRRIGTSGYFHCKACDVYFHGNWCYYFPRKMRHPYHPQHPLSFSFFDKSRALLSDGNVMDYRSSHGKCESRLVSLQDSPNNLGECDWCGEDDLTGWFYRCSVCGFTLDDECSRLDPPLTIQNPKSHHHDLTLLPRPLLTPCDACGSVDAREPPYGCLQCSYVVHKECIDLPRVIKLMYHPHRLSHIPHLPYGKWLCGICHKDIDIKHGAYSCANGCPNNFFHSKCATSSIIWNGKELEWEPEETEDPKDIEPFVKVSDKEISHFSHEHHLWLHENGIAHDDAHKQCQGCLLPVGFGFGDSYSCMQCEFFLHTTCASLPRKIYHGLHYHPLKLEPMLSLEGYTCDACYRIFSGFRYTCNECTSFNYDVRCASISSPFNYINHQHPLYYFNRDTKGKLSCKGCDRSFVFGGYRLECTNGCDFGLCFTCVTLPTEVRYKYDEHMLTLCFGQDSDGPYWCEACEREFNPKKSFYACNECSVALHVDCAFGSLVYLKHGQSFNFKGNLLEIVRNNSSTRPVCSECLQRCRDTVFLKEKDADSYTCSRKCMEVHYDI